MNTYKNLSMWLVIGLTAILLVNLFNQKTESRLPMTYSQFWTNVETGAIRKVTIQGGKVLGYSADGQPFAAV
ncbi:MAG: cell division protein FtsH, partial [Candidatus Electrothrix sp. AR1]|nr:cell division protein FtsH [Candidatus Electrothrix sp. AR1]